MRSTQNLVGRAGGKRKKREVQKTSRKIVAKSGPNIEKGKWEPGRRERGTAGKGGRKDETFWVVGPDLQDFRGGPKQGKKKKIVHKGGDTRTGNARFTMKQH